MSYADIRKRELEYIERQLADDRAMKWEMRRLFNRANTDIQDRIDAELFKLAHDEKITMADAKRLISKTDVEAFHDTAKRMADQRDLSKRANRELRRYNVTMRTNRLEYIQARMHLSTLELAEQAARTTERRLIEAHMKEYERQAGIFGMTLPSKERMLASARAVAFADVSGATFSDRIWADQAELREGVNRAIERALIRGEHPRTASAEIAQSVRDEITNKRHKADRILITETARAQTLAQREAFKDADVKEYIYIAEGDACVVCKALDGQIFKVADMKTGVNAPFMHPFCRCSTAGHVEDLPETPEEPTTPPAPETTDDEHTIPFEPAKTMAQANKYAKETLGIPEAKYNGVALEVANEWNEALRDTFEKFPELQKRMQFVGSTQERNKKLRADYEVYALRKLRERNPDRDDSILKPYAKRQAQRALRGFRPGPNNLAQSFTSDKPVYKNVSGVVVNKNNASNYTIMKRGLEGAEKSQWNPVGSNSPRSLLDHEIGHQLDSLLGIRNKEHIQDLYDSRTREQIKADLSEYAWNNNNPDRYGEMIAEGWAEYMNNPEPREIARVVGETIEAEYDAKFGRNK